MSIVCNYYYAITENGKRSLILGAELRKMLLARYQVQRNLYRFQQQISKIRGYGADALEHGRSAAQHISSLDGMHSRLHDLRSSLEQAKSGVLSQISRIEDAQNAAVEEQQALDAAIEDASAMLKTLDALQNTPIGNIERLSELFEHQIGAIEDLEYLEREIVKLETELQFISREREFQPMAAAALSAMSDNGYEIRETVSEEGLLAYFEQAESGRRIAVRIAYPVQEDRRTEKWEVLAETFRMTGERCLMEMEDFETSLEERGGRLDFGDIRIYPKEDHSVQREKRGLLPDLSRILKMKRTGPGARVSEPARRTESK